MLGSSLCCYESLWSSVYTVNVIICPDVYDNIYFPISIDFFGSSLDYFNILVLYLRSTCIYLFFVLYFSSTAIP